MVIKTDQKKIPCGFFLKKDFSIINLLLSKNYNTPSITTRTARISSLNISQYFKIKHDTSNKLHHSTKKMPPVAIKYSSLGVNYSNRSSSNFRRDILVKDRSNDLNITSLYSSKLLSPCFPNRIINEGMMTNISFRNLQSINKRNMNMTRNDSYGRGLGKITCLPLFQTELLLKKNKIYN